MAQTPLTTQTGYATPDEIKVFIDYRTIADLLSDSGVPVPVASLPTYQPFLDIILAASGDLESVVVKALRYKPEDLQAIYDNGGAAKWFLVRLVAGSTLGILYQRRPDKSPTHPVYLDAMAKMKQLSDGVSIFPTQEAAAAGIIDDQGDQLQDVVARGGAAFTAQRYFGTRTDFMPNRIP